MLLLPFDKTTYKSKLSVEEIKNRLHELIDKKPKSQYKGRLTGNNFYITHYSKIMMNRGSGFITIINGNFQPNKDGESVVSTTTRLQYSAFIIMVLFILVWIYAAFSAKHIVFNGNSVKDEYFIIRLLPIVLTYLFFSIPYWISNIKIKNTFKKILSAEIVV